MDYLHGDVPEDELEAACCYEYARESEILLEIAAINKTALVEVERGRGREAKRRKKIGLPPPDGGPGGVEIYFSVNERFKFDPPSWFMEPPWSYIWYCPSFPEKSWLQLKDSERVDICRAVSSSGKKVHPLQMHNVTLLDSMGVFDSFKTMSERARRDRDKVLPIIEGWPKQKGKPKGSLFSVLFTLNFTKQKKQLLQEFDAWLELPEIKELRKKHERKTTGSTGTLKDRLKDLAAWRLYRKLRCDRALDFADNNRKRDATGKPRAFHDPRIGRLSKVPINLAHLYREKSGFLKANARALRHLRDLIPWEVAISQTKPTGKKGF